MRLGIYPEFGEKGLGTLLKKCRGNTRGLSGLLQTMFLYMPGPSLEWARTLQLALGENALLTNSLFCSIFFLHRIFTKCDGFC